MDAVVTKCGHIIRFYCQFRYSGTDLRGLTLATVPDKYLPVYPNNIYQLNAARPLEANKTVQCVLSKDNKRIRFGNTAINSGYTANTDVIVEGMRIVN